MDENGYKGRQASKMKTKVLQIILGGSLKGPEGAQYLVFCSQIVTE